MKRAVLDTNVLVSGIFFGGKPREVIDAWIEGRLELVLTPSIIDEYVRTLDHIGESHPELEYESLLAVVIGHSVLLPDESSAEPITSDPDDDKFMLCARASGAVVVSGDHHLLDVAGWEGVPVLPPRDFLTSLQSS